MQRGLGNVLIVFVKVDTFLQQLYSMKGEQQILVHSSYKYLSTIILSLINFLSCHLHCLFLYATNKPIQQLFWMLAIHIASTMLSPKVTIMPFPSSHILVIARGFPFPLSCVGKWIHFSELQPLPLQDETSSSTPLRSSIPDLRSPKHLLLLAPDTSTSNCPALFSSPIRKPIPRSSVVLKNLVKGLLMN